ncbi:MAG TPA: alginate export family protein [Bryobacteraceae bacterium]|nr:alginate export family protein [Bryobacteraceae bacterium]
MEKCVYSPNGRNWTKILFHKTLGGRSLFAAGAVLLFTAGMWAQVAPGPAGGGRPSDTVVSPVGAIAGQPTPDTGGYDLPDSGPVGLLNQQLPRWLQFGLEERLRVEGYSGGSFKPGNDDAYGLNRFRFGMIVSPASWFRVVAQLQDARPIAQNPPYGPPNQVRWDLKQAYAEFGNSETQPISIRVGRQLIDYNNTIIGNSEWRNQGRSFDAVVTNIHVDRYRLGIFAASVVNPLDPGISHHQEGNNIYGLYGGIDRIIPKSVIEPFTLWRVAPSVTVENSKSKGRLDERAYGFRIRGSRLHNFDYRAEWIAERGSAGANSISAWATTFGAGYQFASLHGKPRIFGGYDYGSGDKNPKDGVRNTFDTMYPNAHDRFGITDQFGWQNIIAYRGGATVRLHRRLTLTGQYLDFDLANAADGIYNTSGSSIARDTTGKSGTHVGEEVDVYGWYELNRQVHIGAGIGHLMPGSFLASVTKGAAYTYPYFVVHFLDGVRIR